jgi:hypothetical protein
MAGDSFSGNHVTVHPQSEAGVATTEMLARRIAEGLAFRASYTATVGTGTAVSVLIEVPATGAYHMIVECECKKAGTFVLSEDPNATATSGTAVTSFNLNRKSATSGGLTLTGDGTYTSAGTVLERHVIGGISGPNAQSAPYLLNVSKKYLGRFTADGTTSETVFNLLYYKES